LSTKQEGDRAGQNSGAKWAKIFELKILKLKNFPYVW
jgi:hypothetical protein